MSSNKKDQPKTGNGRTGGKKPAKTQVTVQTSTGTHLLRATANLFTKRGKGPKGGR